MRDDLAPVKTSSPAVLNQGYYKVLSGDTLYAIAFRYDKDYQQLARFNRLRFPYYLRVGQIIYIPRSKVSSGLAKSIYHDKLIAKPGSLRSRSFIPIVRRKGSWIWPVKGKIVSEFSPKLSKKGIDIAGRKGEWVHAASAGTVAYAGKGLTGYGNLIIIKHDNQYLTAYGNNAEIKVKEGQVVKRGQIIAQVGVIDRKYWGIHFEIRRRGIPINPLEYLQ